MAFRFEYAHGSTEICNVFTDKGQNQNVWDYVPLYAVPEKAPAEIPEGTYYPHIRCYIQEVPA